MVDRAKIFGLNVSNNLRWNNYFDQILSKARKRLYFLSQLKKAKVGEKGLVLFYMTCIHVWPILEYASPVFHNGLTNYLGQNLERIQKRVLRIILTEVSCEDALRLTGLQRLSHRSDGLSDKLFEEIVTDDSHKLYSLLPPRNETVIWISDQAIDLMLHFKPTVLKNSFIIHNAMNYSF